MAAVTRRILAVLGEAFAHGDRFSAGLGFQISIYGGRGRRYRQSENIVQQPFATQDRRGAVGVERSRQQRSFGEQPAALIVIRKRDAAEATAVTSRNSVVPRQPLVDE